MGWAGWLGWWVGGRATQHLFTAMYCSHSCPDSIQLLLSAQIPHAARMPMTRKQLKKHKVLFKGKFFFKVQVSMRNAAAARYDDRTHMMLWRAGVPGVSMPTQCIGG